MKGCIRSETVNPKTAYPTIRVSDNSYNAYEIAKFDVAAPHEIKMFADYVSQEQHTIDLIVSKNIFPSISRGLHVTADRQEILKPPALRLLFGPFDISPQTIPEYSFHRRDYYLNHKKLVSVTMMPSAIFCHDFNLAISFL